MKKFVFVALLFFSVLASGSAAEILQSEYTFASYAVTSVYRNDKGIVVKILADTVNPRQLYIPQKWFLPTDGNATIRKAKLSYIDDKQTPYIVVYYKGDEFYHAQLYMPKGPSNHVWKLIPNHMDFSEQFESDTLIIE